MKHMVFKNEDKRMAVNAAKENNKLKLELDNGDLVRFEEVIKAWNFKNEQAFLRFVVSLLIETEDKSLWMKSNGEITKVEPADHSIEK